MTCETLHQNTDKTEGLVAKSVFKGAGGNTSNAWEVWAGAGKEFKVE